MTKGRFVVTLDVPDGVSREEMALYILEAVQTHKGSFNPETNPLFDLDYHSVVVRDEAYKFKVYTSEDDGNDYKEPIGDN